MFRTLAAFRRVHEIQWSVSALCLPGLAQLQAIRRELAAVRENQETFSRQQVQVVEGLEELRRLVGHARSDIVQLENITRHNEILSILNRLDESDRERRRYRMTIEERAANFPLLSDEDLTPEDERS
jgi:hypothetical protein